MKRQLAVSVELASRFNAHLIGLAVLPAAVVLPHGANASGSARHGVVNGRYRAGYRDETERMGRTFRAACADRKFTHEWIVEDEEDLGSGPAAIDYAFPVDLIVSGPSEAFEREQPGSISERLVFESGRPVLVLPRGGSGSVVGGRVLIAWNGSRESTKAAFDALPLLQLAARVTVLVIGESAQQGNGHGQPSAERLCNAFARHDVNARAETIMLPGAEIGPALLSAVKAESADLLVMGCLGYPRMYDFTLGSASRHVLRESPVPVLMSH